jgi:ankyrin repeat protein
MRARVVSGRRLRVVLVLLWSLCRASAADVLLVALRAGDRAEVQRLVANGTPVDVVDDHQSSALMYAALYADTGTMRLLLAHGADPNHADENGATPLMWAIPDDGKVRLLLGHGANVNAVSGATGQTPLLIAASHPRAAPLVKLLLDRGANPRARSTMGETAIMRAAFNGDAATVSLLLSRGVDPNLAGRGSTPLIDAVTGDNRPVIDLLLAHGADATATDEDGIGVLASATSYSDIALFRKLIRKGADPKVRSHDGVDLMMMAAAADGSSPALITELVRLGVNPGESITNLHVEHGFGKTETPLDWAARHGSTDVTLLLTKLSPQARPPDEVTQPALLGATSPAQAITTALPLLYEGGREFFQRSGCASCHHNALPAIAFSLARSHGIPVDAERARRNYLQSVAYLSGNTERFLQNIRIPGGDTAASFLTWGLTADEHPRDRLTDAVVHHLAGEQSLDGGWRLRSHRPPMESSRVTPTALSIRVLRSYTIPGRQQELDGRVRAAINWLAAYAPRTGEEHSMRLLGLVWGDAPSRTIATAAGALLRDQRPDGGWGQLPTLPSDAYATGQALFALSTARQLPRDASDKGVRFLLRTQRSDGSWHVHSRSYPVLPRYFATGFPHGRDQWISSAGTSWACIGLAVSLDAK